MPKVHLVLPAAGVGKRFGSATPKQYVEINGKTVFEWTLRALSNIDLVDQRIVALHPSDANAKNILYRYPEYQTVVGGHERSNSVLNALRKLSTTQSTLDWVLVHDIARPCIRPTDVVSLIQHCIDTGVGSVLGRPMTDTIKQINDHGQWQTIDRSTLWSVQTPQCFQLGMLISALEFCEQHNIAVTDEASAIEALQGTLQIIKGAADNIKLTHAEDAALIAHYLNQQNR